VVRRLTPGPIAELVARYEAGATIRDLAKAYEMHRHTVAGHLQSLGVEMRRQGLAADQVDQAVTLYERGLSLERIGQRLGASAGTVRRMLIRRNVAMRTSYDHMQRAKRRT
jgi:DNA-binding IclR family transcriptional regulator